VTRHITIVSASVGAGHDGAAAELARRLRERGFCVDRHDFLDLLPASLGRLLRQTYALQLRAAPESWGRLFTALEQRPALAAAACGLSGLAARRVARTVAPGSAAVVSTALAGPPRTPPVLAEDPAEIVAGLVDRDAPAVLPATREPALVGEAS
jgi:hypothetical protein